MLLARTLMTFYWLDIPVFCLRATCIWITTKRTKRTRRKWWTVAGSWPLLCNPFLLLPEQPILILCVRQQSFIHYLHWFVYI